MKKKLLLALPVLLVAIQLIPAPAKTNPPSDPARSFAAIMKPPADVEAIIQRACHDCHSNETKWPWYADVAPVSWPVRYHVVDGRKHLNFSEWLKPGETSFTRWSDLEDLGKAVADKSMPFFGYDWMYPEAKLTPAERTRIVQWADSAIGVTPK